MKFSVPDSSCFSPWFFRFSDTFYQKERQAFLSSVFSPYEVFRALVGVYFYRGYCITHVGAKEWIIVKPGFPDFKFPCRTLSDSLNRITYSDFGGEKSE